MKGSFWDNLKVLNRRRLFKHVRDRRLKIRNIPRGARKPKPSAEAEEFAKQEVTEIVTEEPEFEMLRKDTKIPQLKPRYFRGKLDNHFEKFVEVVRRLSINIPLLDALQVPTYSRYFKDILANKYEIATLGVDHVKMSEQCSAAIANGLGKQKTPDAQQFHVPLVPSSSRRHYATLEQV
jgi:DNA primase catalytic subunit